MVSMQFDGGARLAKTLAALPENVSGQVLRQALLAVAEPMRATMASRAPRRPPAPDLADHIVVSPVSSIAGVDGGKAERLADTEAAVGIGPAKGYFYASFLEYGTVKMSAQPFMRPAFDEHVAGTVKALALQLWVALTSRGFSGGAGAVGGTGQL
jgi:HK97 gp10 family phage protein